MKKVIKVKKPSKWQMKYDVLKQSARTFADAVRNRKEHTAYHYLLGLKSAPVDNVATLSKLNVVTVSDLYGYVMTAQKLGHVTELRADGDKLLVVFLSQLPSIPYEFTYC